MSVRINDDQGAPDAPLGCEMELWDHFQAGGRRLWRARSWFTLAKPWRAYPTHGRRKNSVQRLAVGTFLRELVVVRAADGAACYEAIRIARDGAETEWLGAEIPVLSRVEKPAIDLVSLGDEVDKVILSYAELQTLLHALDTAFPAPDLYAPGTQLHALRTTLQDAQCYIHDAAQHARMLAIIKELHAERDARRRK